MTRIRYLFILSLIFWAQNLIAQKYSIDYKFSEDPFEWRVNAIEKFGNSTRVYLSVENTSGIDQIVPLYLDNMAYFPGKKYILKSQQYARMNNSNDEFTVKPGTSKDLIITIPNLDFFDYKEISITIGSKYNLEGITLAENAIILNESPNNITENNIPETDNNSTLENNQMEKIEHVVSVDMKDNEELKLIVEDWENFYQANKKINLTYKDMNEIYSVVEAEIAEWEKKGEFETTTAWQNRVTESSKKKYKETILLQMIDQHEQELMQQKEEEKKLRGDFDRLQSGDSADLKKSDPTDSCQFTLMSYDADNERFLIKTSKYGEIKLFVPLQDAENFKNNWDQIKDSVKLEFSHLGDEVRLSRIKFINGKKTYIFKTNQY